MRHAQYFAELIVANATVDRRKVRKRQTIGRFAFVSQRRYDESSLSSMLLICGMGSVRALLGPCFCEP